MSKTNALAEWQEQVSACRSACWETEDQAWQRAAAWYEDWVRHNDYVQLTLPLLLPFIHSGARILEVGPGTGAFTVPLARSAREVVAVEPSPNMREILNRNLAEAEITNVNIIKKPIEEAVRDLDDCFDLVFASFSLYNVLAIDIVIRDLMRVAKRIVALMGTGESRAWYRDIYQRFRGKNPVPPPQLPHFYAMLSEMGIYADVQGFRSSCNNIFDSEDELVDWWQYYFHLDETERAALRTSLLPLVERRGHQIGIYSRRGAALISIERGRNWLGDTQTC